MASEARLPLTPGFGFATPVRTGRLARSVRAAKLWLLGSPPVSRLTLTQCIHSAAETFFTVSMAGSLFFSVSADAARPRVLFYLALTLAPFAVMAPLIGPFIDRVRGGIGVVMVGTFLVRSVLALLLAENLRSLLLFPLAFVLLVVAKTYSVGRNALVPSLVDDHGDLVAANSRLSRSATIAGALAGALAVPLYASTSGAWSLRAAAVLYVVGAGVAWRTLAVARPIESATRDGMVELVQLDVAGAIWDMAALRAAIGFAIFHLGFALKAEAEPAWFFGAVIVANSTGGFLGTVVSPMLRERMSEQSMFTLALSLAASGAVINGLSFNRYTLVGAIGALGLAVSIGRRAFDSTIQRQAPHARRGRMYAGLETRLELAWGVGAFVAVATRLASWAGLLFLAGFLVSVAVLHYRRYKLLPLLEREVRAPLAERLVERAEVLEEYDHFDEAIAVALSAIDAAGCPAVVEAEVVELRRIAKEGTGRQLRDGARRAIRLAQRNLSGGGR